MAVETETPRAGSPDISRTELFLGFAKIGLLGFGGVAPWARHVIVTDRRWFSEREYASILGIGQVLPGANTVNAAIIIGDRFQGVSGAVISVLALLCMPITVLIGIAVIYDRISTLPSVGAAITAGAAAASGLVIGTALKMAWKIKPNARTVVVGLAAFVSVGLLTVPMAIAIAIIGPLSIAAAWWERRR